MVMLSRIPCSDKAHRENSDRSSSADVVFGLAYDELRRLAHAVRRNRPDATLSTTDLLHEAWFKLQPVAQLGIDDETFALRTEAHRPQHAGVANDG